MRKVIEVDTQCPLSGFHVWVCAHMHHMCVHLCPYHTHRHINTLYWWQVTHPNCSDTCVPAVFVSVMAVWFPVWLSWWKEDFLTFKQTNIICDVRKILHGYNFINWHFSSIAFFKLYLLINFLKTDKYFHWYFLSCFQKKLKQAMVMSPRALCLQTLLWDDALGSSGVVIPSQCRGLQTAWEIVFS